tara:strand:- start:1265 stop:1480 length:216 start_codon:yes stop_codon:yes gene_type:complete
MAFTVIFIIQGQHIAKFCIDIDSQSIAKIISQLGPLRLLHKKFTYNQTIPFLFYPDQSSKLVQLSRFVCHA